MRSHHTKGSASLRESGGFEASENPFRTGESLEKFEIKTAKLRAQGNPDIVQFNNEDFNNPNVRDFTQMQQKSQRMRKLLFDQQVDIQKRCDFLDIKKKSIESSIQNEEEIKPKEDHPMFKYSQMTEMFDKKLQDENKKFVKDYQVARMHHIESREALSPKSKQT